MRGRVPAILGSLAASAVLALALPGAAHAAQGAFQYRAQSGVPELLNNPVDNQCYNVGNAGGSVRNDTNRHAELYAAPGCQGDAIQTLNPGDDSDWSEFQGVRFTR
ncbi:hypothetical protein QR77_34450 [Streptomyces sp. 150FB]|uniref:hypothetical protein n=1 Tax=Streptomyces sp. 150FB TaxID=1576605 RepID=UPI00058911BF|nr:hypothetical protein [Streptomyces sp. 150FB]KIF77570.1 hypothetical protein QR77_34450 [Streptomyces sp. 150FB]